MLNVTFLDCNSNKWKGDSRDIKEGSYTLEDLVLIRATDIFPFNGVIETPTHGGAYVYSNSSLLGDAISKALRKIYSDFEERVKEKRKYNIVFEYLRSTIHFTVNGLVGNHDFNNFDSRNYIIIEPLKYHINDNSLCSLHACDTYFNDDMVLSDEAVIIIPIDKYNEIKDKEEYVEVLKKFKIFVYSGKNEQLAVSNVLECLGYDSFLMGNNGYVNGFDEKTAAGKMWSFFDELRERYGKEFIRHMKSKFRLDDADANAECSKNVEKQYLEYLLVNSNVSSFVIENIKNYKQLGLLDKIDEEEVRLNYYNINDVMARLVEDIGLDNLLRLTKEFNEKYIEDLKKRKKNSKNRR